jgi:ATP-dependent RNA helicase RhlE
MFVDKPDKQSADHLLNAPPEAVKSDRFCATRHGANKIERKLENAGIRAEAIHSDKTQRARMNALRRFRDGRVRVWCDRHRFARQSMWMASRTSSISIS